MTKQEIINKYGIEWYNRHANYSRMKHKERYSKDSEFKSYCSNRYRARYVMEGKVELIKNYELAKADNFRGWVIHHINEICDTGSSVILRSKKELIEIGKYYNCQPEELIWLTVSEHNRIHNKYRRIYAASNMA